MRYKAHERIGQRFSLLVVESVYTINHFSWANVVCDCGVRKSVRICDLTRVKSCGCLHRKHLESNRTHGLTDVNPRLHGIWNKMKRRCDNPVDTAYKNYGGRGIKVCAEWYDYPTFFNWALSSGYHDTMTIERKRVNEGYCPENCTWIPRGQQNWNTRKAIGLEKFNQIKSEIIPGVSTRELANKFGVSKNTIWRVRHNKTYQQQHF